MTRSPRPGPPPPPAPPPAPPLIRRGIGFALFTSEAGLLSGRAVQVVIAPNPPLLPAGQRTEVTPDRYSSPTIYNAVRSLRGGHVTVDVVLGLAWTDAQNQSHPAYALLSGLGPQPPGTVPVDYNAVFSFDGAGYDGTGSKAAGPLRWEIKLRNATGGRFAYTGSSSAYVPCGAGCGDPRDRAGGNVDGLPGTVKVSLVAGVTDSGDSKLLLWAWDPIVKARWLWPSGYGTAQGGFKNGALELQLPAGIRLAAESNPKVRVLRCPPRNLTTIGDVSGASQDDALCLWVGLMTEAGQLAFHRSLEVQEAGCTRLFSPRHRTQMPPPLSMGPPTPPPPRAARASLKPAVEATRAGLTLHNKAFRLVVAAGGADFTLTELRSGLSRTFSSAFAVVSTVKDPVLSDLKDGDQAKSTGSKLSGLYFAADNIPSYWRRPKTLTIFDAGDAPAEMATATACSPLNNSAIALRFAPGGGGAGRLPFTLTASLALPAGTELPRLSWSVTTTASGFFSVGFVGAPHLAANSSVPFAQPANCYSARGWAAGASYAACPLKEGLVFPDAGTSLPYAMVSGGNSSNVALITDPSTFPFEPCVEWPDAPSGFSKTCPTRTCSDDAKPDACQNRGWASEARSSIGLYRGEEAVPLIFAPVFGGFGSQVSKLPGHMHTFTLQLLVHEGSPSDTYRKLASEVYAFRDERDNSGPGSLNAAMERMGDYLADADGSNFLQWDAIQKYSFYWMDNACAFKPLDFMSGLSIALTTDDERLYTLFGLEMAKFALSRSDSEHYLWPYHKTNGLGNSKDAAGHFGMGQNHGAGFATAAEIMQIYRLTGSRSSALPALAGLTSYNASLPCPNADSNYDVLLFYESTAGAAREHWWNCTLEAAFHLTMIDAHTPQPPAEYKCTNADFFVSLFQLTNDGAHARAAQLCEANCENKYQVFPRATAADGETITVDVGNRSLSYWWTHGRWGSWGWPLEKEGMWAREQTVPTWRASHNGLDTSGTGSGWLGTLSLDSPVRMLRVATLGNDSYARALAKASIVGRFGHFPGDFQSKPKHTLLWEDPELANHVLPKETQTTWNTGHFWPILGVVLDFMMTDAADRSSNAILFPSTYVNGIPFGRLYSPALGQGRFYNELAYAWLPAGLFTAVSNTQFNWIAAYSVDAVYIVLMSQSFMEESVDCLLNEGLVGGLSSASITSVWINNAEVSPQSILLNNTAGSFSADHVPPKGTVALKLSGAVAKTRLHQKVLPSAGGNPPLSPHSRVVQAEGGAFGIVSAMALSWGTSTELFAFSQANSTMFGGMIAKDPRATSHTVFDQVTLHWAIDDGSEHNTTGTVSTSPDPPSPVYRSTFAGLAPTLQQRASCGARWPRHVGSRS